MSAPTSSSPKNRKRTILLVLLLLLLALIALLFTRCKKEPAAPLPPPSSAPSSSPTASDPAPAAPTTATEEPAEILTPATIQLHAHTMAGSAFSAVWTGPDNKGDYLAIAKPDAPATAYETYAETKHGRTLELTAPIEPGAYEVRYIANRSKTILGRTPLHVAPITATLNAPASAHLNTPITVVWTGPNNENDFLTIVPPDAPDDAYDKYTNTAKGSPATLVTPAKTGRAEIRYVTGQGRKILYRRAIDITAPETTITAPAEVIAGTPVVIDWTGLASQGDYLTIVPPDAKPGVYQNYTDASKGTSLTVTAPIEPGAYEIRYAAAQGKTILARRPIKVVAAKIELTAPAEAAAGSPVSVQWTGPNNKGDYLTIVVKGTRDGDYAQYSDTQRGTPATIKAPAKPGPAEIRYMSGQGAKVLARRAIDITP
jgi:Ca-activated chloride channel family protein